MMYLTNSQLVTKLVSVTDNVTEIIEDFELIELLIKKYGSKLKSERIMKEILSIDKDLYGFMVLLKKLGKLNLKDVTNIKKSLLRQKIGDATVFSVNMPNVKSSEKIKKDIKNQLDKKFKKVELEEKDDEKVGLAVSGDGLFYKRFIEDDLDKIL